MEKIILVLCILPAIKVFASFPDCDCRPVDGGLTEWTQFSPCSASCGQGTQTRVRYCTNPYPQYGGKDCSEYKLSESKSCKLKDCPINGGWSKETEGTCSKTCGGGRATVTRSCTNPSPSKCGKKCAGWETKIVSCNIQPCPKPEWGDWDCGKCDNCTEKCTRKCMEDGNEVPINRCPREDHGDTMFKNCCNDHPMLACTKCYEKALKEATKQNTDYWKTNWIGHACRAHEVQANLAAICKNFEQSKNGGISSNNWFWIHCSPDGPWCKPCATRGQVFNRRCDACEATRNGPCSGTGK